jgi:hypothetical protein
VFLCVKKEEENEWRNFWFNRYRPRREHKAKNSFRESLRRVVRRLAIKEVVVGGSSKPSFELGLFKPKKGYLERFLGEVAEVEFE